DGEQAPEHLRGAVRTQSSHLYLRDAACNSHDSSPTWLFCITHELRFSDRSSISHLDSLDWYPVEGPHAYSDRSAFVMSTSEIERANTTPMAAQDVRDIAIDAYIYLYPLITMDLTRLQSTNIEAGKEIGKGPMDTFVNMAEYPPATFRTVVRPNFDT